MREEKKVPAGVTTIKYPAVLALQYMQTSLNDWVMFLDNDVLITTVFYK